MIVGFYLSEFIIFPTFKGTHMAIATGIAKQVKYKQEVTFGVAPVAASAQALRRVTSDINLTKQTYESNEIRADYQVADMRHGVREVAGTINGELSPGTYKDFIAASLRKDWAATTAITAASVTIAGTLGAYTVTRATGSYLTDGIKIGDVIRLSVGTLNANNINKNLIVTALTATIATVATVNGTAMTAEGPIASTTITVIGKKTWVPATGHTSRSYSIEHWYSDVTQSEVFTGCKVNQVDVQLPATGMATCNVGFMGQNLTTAAAEYFTSPIAQTSTGVLAAVNGVLYVAGAAIATVTGINFTVNSNITGEAVVGSNQKPELFDGRVTVSGQFTAFFENASLRDLFLNETEAAIIGVFTTSSANTADFMSFVFPRIKAGGASKDDGEKGIIQTIPFTALLNTTGGTALSSHATTISIQDSTVA